MREEDAVLQMIHRFIKAGLTHDVDCAMSFISENVMGVGMNEQGTIGSRDELRALLEAQSQFSGDSFRIHFPNSQARYHPPGFATASVVYELCYGAGEDESKSAYIQTVAARKEGGVWKICLLQAVPVELTEESIENYPLKFADNTLMQIREELRDEVFQFLSSSLSVGILGAYLSEGDLPPFYINDSLLNMLGYTQEEFLEIMAENSFAVVHPDDQERAQREIAEAAQKRQEYTCQYRLVTKSGESRWVVEHGKQSVQDGRDTILSAFVDVNELVNLQQALEEKNKTILSSITYAARIQKNLLPSEEEFQKAFQDYAILWSPKDIVSGDIYWLRTFEAGTVLCVADCTGHGIPGALLTVLISTTLDNVVDEAGCGDTARIIYDLDRRGAELLHSARNAGDSIMQIRDGCDLAIMFIAKDGSVTFSSANTQVFLCDGWEIKRYRGQRIHIGEGALKGPELVEKIQIPAGGYTFHVATDGLFDQIGGPAGRPFGYQVFRRLALEHHGKKLAEISRSIWEAFEDYRGEYQRRDDVELLSFRP